MGGTHLTLHAVSLFWPVLITLHFQPAGL